jgi:hypothetical protein
MNLEDAHEQLAAIRNRRNIARRRRRYRSRLDKYRAELVALRHAGASICELTAWLRLRRCCVATSTVSRFMAKLPELQEVQP